MLEQIREKHFLAYAADEKSAINEDQRRIRFVISTDSADRDGEIVETDAIAKAIPAFAKNPVCLACHRHSLDNGMPPVVGSWDTDSFKAAEHRSEMDLIFATTDLGETWWNLYRNRHVRAVSIGFRILDGWEEIKDKIRVYHIIKIELYEISCVPVPANAQALSKLKEWGIADDLELSRSQSGEKSLADRISAMEKNILESVENLRLKIEDLLINDPDGLGEFSLGKGSIPPVEAEHKTENLLNAIANTIH